MSQCSMMCNKSNRAANNRKCSLPVHDHWHKANVWFYCKPRMTLCLSIIYVQMKFMYLCVCQFFFLSLLVILSIALILHRCPWSLVSEAASSFSSSSSAAVSVPAAACTRCAASQDVSSPFNATPAIQSNKSIAQGCTNHILSVLMLWLSADLPSTDLTPLSE